MVLRTRREEQRVFLISANRLVIGSQRSVLSFAYDITERKIMEAELRRSEEKFSHVFHASPVPINLTRFDDGQIQDANPAFVEHFGWPREALVGQLTTALRHWLDETQRQAFAATLGRAGSLRDYPAVLLDRAGQSHDCLISADTVMIGGMRHIVAIILDITERKRAEEALQASQARLIEAQRVGQIGSWEYDMRTRHMSCSAEMLHIYERSEAEFDGRWESLRDMTHPDDRAALQHGFQESARRDSPYELEHRILTPAGGLKYLRVRWQVFADEAGLPLKILGTTQDITEQVLAHQEIERLNAGLEQRVEERTAELTSANRELESFAYSISHDLRAPLRGIDGFSKLLVDDYRERLDARGIDYLDRVRRAAQRMGHLIDDILELSRVTRQDMQRQVVDLSRQAREILDEYASTHPEYSPRTLIAPDCLALGDAQLLRVVMQNLLENACKYSRTQAAPVIEFGQETYRGEPVFFVRDNGVGFDMQYVERLFKPFSRLHRADEFEGSGIGLASVARVLHRHGGRFWIESAPGQGTVVRFALSRP